LQCTRIRASLGVHEIFSGNHFGALEYFGD
jgi:hypothetical protein